MKSNKSLFLAAGQLRKAEADPEILEAYNRAHGYRVVGDLHRRDDWEKAQIAKRTLLKFDGNNFPYVNFVEGRYQLKPDLDLVE